MVEEEPRRSIAAAAMAEEEEEGGSAEERRLRCETLDEDGTDGRLERRAARVGRAGSGVLLRGEADGVRGATMGLLVEARATRLVAEVRRARVSLLRRTRGTATSASSIGSRALEGDGSPDSIVVPVETASDFLVMTARAVGLGGRKGAQ